MLSNSKKLLIKILNGVDIKRYSPYFRAGARIISSDIRYFTEQINRVYSLVRDKRGRTK